MRATEFIEGLGGGQGGGRITLECTRPLGPKTSVAAPWQILDVILFRRFPSTPSEFWHETTWVGKLISLSFQRYIERPKRSPYVAWASVLMRPTPAVRTRLEVELDFNSNWAMDLIFTWAIMVSLGRMSSFNTLLIVVIVVIVVAVVVAAVAVVV